MEKTFFLIIKTSFVLIFFTFLFSSAIAADIKDTRLLKEPAISENRIAFVYAKDLWVANTDGTGVQRLTSEGANVSNPAFSPDGSLIAFTCDLNGNEDVYIIPSEGGFPSRLTWHPGKDRVRGFTPDGKSVIFTSRRDSAFHAINHLFTVSVEGGAPCELPIFSIYDGTYSPDGKNIAFNPLPDAFTQWKDYRGGMTSEIWISSLNDYSVEKLPQPEKGCNDINPMWEGDKIYFLSDREGEFNLFSFDINSKNIKQLTEHKDFPVLNASAKKDKIIYEQSGYLHIYDLSAGSGSKLTVGVASDLPETGEKYIKGKDFIRIASLSPTGKRAVFEVRGEIITLPAEKGDPRNITETQGANERSPVWSPDGKYIAYFSDEKGEYQLYVENQDGKGEPKRYELPGAGFYETPVWSPDGKKIAYTDNSWSLYWINLETGISTKIASEIMYGTEKNIDPSWSPDSKWIAYTINSEVFIQQIYLYSLEEDRSFLITDGLSDASNPVFDTGGKYLYFFASTDTGPAKHWFDQSNTDLKITKNIYLAVLDKNLPSPLAKESDEEEGPEKEENTEETPHVTVDLKDINYRIVSLPVPADNYRSLQAGKEGILYYLDEGHSTLYSYDFLLRKEDVIIEGINFYNISEDREKILYSTGGNLWGIIPAWDKSDTGEGKIATENIEIKINPLEEWEQIFNEAWRINRDYFYDPNMHGVDWQGMKEKYSRFLPHLSCCDDLYRVLIWLGSELRVGHHMFYSADSINTPETIPGGLLGADYEILNGRYRIKKIYGGLNWYPGLRSPLTEPGIEIKEGDYIIRVNGKDVTEKTSIYSFFENTAETIVEITVSSDPSGAESRTFRVVPVATEGELRKRDWIEENIKKVHAATDGRVAYVYVPDTYTDGYNYFKEYFFPQSDKEAIIIDERFNGGGKYPDYYIDILRRDFSCFFSTRYGKDMMTPQSFIPGPKVMIINECAGSGGDLLPWTFRKFGMGTLVGKRTWGGLVGTLGYPVLMDGSYISAPNFAAWDKDEWIVENVGVSPDIEVEQWPADMISGKDPQLEKAIEIVMEELMKNPPEEFQRPPYPVKNE